MVNSRVDDIEAGVRQAIVRSYRSEGVWRWGDRGEVEVASCFGMSKGVRDRS